MHRAVKENFKTKTKINTRIEYKKLFTMSPWTYWTTYCIERDKRLQELLQKQ